MYFYVFKESIGERTDSIVIELDSQNARNPDVENAFKTKISKLRSLLTEIYLKLKLNPATHGEDRDFLDNFVEKRLYVLHSSIKSKIENVEETGFDSDFSQKFQDNIKKYCPYREATRILFPPENPVDWNEQFGQWNSLEELKVYIPNDLRARLGEQVERLRLEYDSKPKPSAKPVPSATLTSFFRAPESIKEQLKKNPLFFEGYDKESLILSCLEEGSKSSDPETSVKCIAFLDVEKLSPSDTCYFLTEDNPIRLLFNSCLIHQDHPSIIDLYKTYHKCLAVSSRLGSSNQFERTLLREILFTPDTTDLRAFSSARLRSLFKCETVFESLKKKIECESNLFKPLITGYVESYGPTFLSAEIKIDTLSQNELIKYFEFGLLYIYEKIDAFEGGPIYETVFNQRITFLNSCFKKLTSESLRDYEKFFENFSDVCSEIVSISKGKLKELNI